MYVNSQLLKIFVLLILLHKLKIKTRLHTMSCKVLPSKIIDISSMLDKHILLHALLLV